MSLIGEFWMDFEKESQTKKDLHNARAAFRNISINIDSLPRYPDNELHQECFIYLPGNILPFEMRKGEDGYHYHTNGKEKKYNLREDGEVSQNWIVHLSSCSLSLPNKSLRDIFEIKESKSLVEIIRYCIDLYKKSLAMEVIRINEELEILNK